MREINNSYQTLYRQALVDPSKLNEEDILALLVKYPYSQPLIFAYERRKALLNELPGDKSHALLYSPSASWLWSFVHRPVEHVEEIIPVDEDYVPFEEWEEPTTVILEVVDDEQIEFEERLLEKESNEQDKEEEQLERLVYEGGVTADYFIFEKNEIGNEIEKENLVKANQEPEEENISLYNDDLMPYSFRWWLHKTRLEHAATYQPFISAPILAKKDQAVVDFGKIDEAILDQQIKENIIHFQDPEMKLSESVRNRPVEPIEVKKTDTIIEKFIREEPIIQAPSADAIHNENMARQSAEDNYALVTETLANIYVDQALYLKAIEVFRKLILKYPEKKSYFATRIQDLEKNL